MAQAELICPTHDALLDVAERLFSRKGFAAVGTREIAQEAGVNIASISYHFGSKTELYVATVRRVMSCPASQQVWEQLRDPPPAAEEAAAVLVRFISQFLAKLLEDHGRDSCCNLMLREAIEPTDAIDSVVRDYMQPHLEMLSRVLEVISPALGKDPARCRLAVLSVLGQMLYHRIALPFLKKMPGQSPAAAPSHQDIARHVARFSLTALGCPAEVIDHAIAVGINAYRPASGRPVKGKQS